MLYFLENQNEHRIGSDFFAGDCRKAVPALAIEVLMNTNPIMIYAGQEFGAREMDCEGFRGRDGRSRIYDYWSPYALRNGYFNSKALSKDQVNLYKKYAILNEIIKMVEKEANQILK